MKKSFNQKEVSRYVFEGERVVWRGEPIKFDYSKNYFLSI